MGETSPFVVGMRVAISASWTVEGYRSDTVAKVYKTGNFVLAGDPKRQWRPESPGGYCRNWHAYETGGRRSRERCQPWSADVDAEIAAALDEKARRDRWFTIRQAMKDVRRAPPIAFLDKIEAALAELEAAETSTPARPLPFTGEAGR